MSPPDTLQPLMKPPESGISVRMYDPGFGDCLLLAFRAEDGKARYMLIDCGVHHRYPDRDERMKLIAEDIVKMHDQYVILRFSNIYGHGLTHKRTVADLFIEKAIKNEPLQITGDGRQRRDFLHIYDAVRAYWSCIKYGHDCICNVGGNEALSINDIATLVEKTYLKVVGSKLPDRVYVEANKDRDWKDFVYSSQLAKGVLNYEPMCSISDEVRERINAYTRKNEKI